MMKPVNQRSDSPPQTWRCRLLRERLRCWVCRRVSPRGASRERPNVVSSRSSGCHRPPRWTRRSVDQVGRFHVARSPENRHHQSKFLHNWLTCAWAVSAQMVWYGAFRFWSNSVIRSFNKISSRHKLQLYRDARESRHGVIFGSQASNDRRLGWKALR